MVITSNISRGFVGERGEEKMSLLQVGLACSLLRESFGELVEKVGTYLLHNGGVSLTDIIGGTGITQNQVNLYSIFFVH